jgi:(S)-citramalyl-CoA lyase
LKRIRVIFTNFLFVPASKPDRFAKALASGAEMICIDLEDSVPADGKVAARVAVIAHMPALDTSRVAVRTNSLRTAEGLADLLALRESAAKPSLIFLPMVESAAEVEIARNVAGEGVSGFVPLVETALGLRLAVDIAKQSGVAAMMFGGGDLSSDLGVALQWDPLLVARSQLIIACAEAKVRCVDVPYTKLNDEAGLELECRQAKALGFHAKAAIHPKQVATIARIMRPSDSELSEAREAIAAFEQAGGAAIRHKGRLLEAPLIDQFRKVLAAAG